MAKVFHFDLFGKRVNKYDFLVENSLKNIDWNLLSNKAPNYFFTDKNFTGESQYLLGFKIDGLFPMNNNGIETGKDLMFYSLSKIELEKEFKSIYENIENALKKYNITNTSSYHFEDKLKNSNLTLEKIRKVSYRPFDDIYCYYDEKIQRRPAFSTMRNMFKQNYALLTPRQFSGDFHHVFISILPTDCNLTGTAKKFGSAPIFPLYLYPVTTSQQNILETPERVPNLNMEIVSEIAKVINLTFVPEKEEESSVCFANSEEVRPEYRDSFAPIDILDYIYAILHSPTYRETYKEFLKIDFPRVPFPKDAETFWKLVRLGGEIRQIHLLESDIVEKYITQYPEDGDNIVGKPRYEDGNVYINEEQYFANVPEVAWNFYIGGYQPAQKWLKDRKERELSTEDIWHYQKIIVALSETDRIMKEIDRIVI